MARSLVGREADPAHVVIYLSGSMRALYDQSIDLVARQLAAACNSIQGADSYAVSGGGSFRVGTDHDVNVRTVAHVTDPGQDVVVLEVDHHTLTMQCLDEMRILRQPLAMAVYAARMVPKVACLIASPAPALTLSRRVFLGISLIIGIVGALAVAAGAWQILSFALPVEWSAWTNRPLVTYVLLVVALVVGLFLRAGDIPKLLDAGQEYYGVVEYLRAGKNAEAYTSRLNDVLAFAGRNYGGAMKHLVAFSYGSVLAFDFLFPKTARAQCSRLASVTFIGFPYVIIDRLWTGYFCGRSVLRREDFRWLNIRLFDDVLGSEIPATADVFAAAGEGVAAPPVPRQEEVEPQRPAKGWDFIARHLSYWDPEEREPAETWRRAAANILARRGPL